MSILICLAKYLLKTLIQPKSKFLLAAQKPYNQSISTEKSGPPAWKQLPTWYGVSENDRMVPPDAQHLFAKQINATVQSINSSHASPLSHPDEVAKVNFRCCKRIYKVANLKGGEQVIGIQTPLLPRTALKYTTSWVKARL